MVNTRYNCVMRMATVNYLAKESIVKGRIRGRGRGRCRGRGSGRVQTIGDRSPIENSPMNENPPAHHEVIEENVDVDD